MGRTANTTTEPADDGFNPKRLEEAGAATQQLGQLHRDYSEERDILNQLIGQSQMAGAFSKFADVVSIGKLKEIKETKMYRALAGKKAFSSDGKEIADVGTWAGFCEMIGKSKSKVDEDLENLNSFGEEAMNQLSAVGAGYRELRQYRKLPADERLALIDVAKTGDKEALVDLAETIMAKHAKEKETLTSELTKSQQTAEARQKVIGDKEAAISRLQEQIAGTPEPEPELAGKTLLMDVDTASLAVGGVIMVLRSKIAKTLNDESGVDIDVARQAAAAALGRCLAFVRRAAEDFGVPLRGPGAEPCAIDQAAEDAAIWAAVNAEMATKNESTH